MFPVCTVYRLSKLDLAVEQICVQVFSKMIADWCGSRIEEEKVPGFRQFVVERFAADCCVYMVLDSSFNLRDANTSNDLVSHWMQRENMHICYEYDVHRIIFWLFRVVRSPLHRY
jgi:hypothetical protein